MSHTAELIAVGTEILLGNIANTDAQMLSEGLSALGINVFYHTVVGDNPQRLLEALAIARKRADIIITTGGLGPTYDDLTKQTICQAFGRALELHPDILEGIRAFFEERLGRTMPPQNEQQAMLPVGCTIFDNPVGTAPGCAFEEGGVHVLMLPGPPHECRYMFENRAVPYLKKLSDGAIVSHELKIFGMGESQVESLLRERMIAMENPTLAPYAKMNECLLRATAKAETAEAAEAMLAPVIEQLRELLGDVVYGMDVPNIETVVLRDLLAKGLTLSTAESCTGGLIAKRLTDLPGASKAFLGGVVSYSNELKRAALQVPGELLDQKGPVSQEVALAMAKGCRALTGSDLAVAVTGVAGPDKDERGNALASPQGALCRPLPHTGRKERDVLRHRAANFALDMVRRWLEGLL